MIPSGARAAEDAASAESVTVPDDLAAAADQLCAEAGDARERAEQARARAQHRVDAAQAEAQAIIEAATAEARELTAAASADDRQAGKLEEQARLIIAAIAEQDRAAGAVHQAADLEAERVRLLEDLADLDGKLGDVGTKRGRRVVGPHHGRQRRQCERQLHELRRGRRRRGVAEQQQLRRWRQGRPGRHRGLLLVTRHAAP